MRSLVNFSLLLVIYGAAMACPNGWRPFPNDESYCARAYTARSDYFQAESACTNQGGHLVSIRNGFENAFVNTLAREVSNQCRYWIGANRFGPSLKNGVNGRQSDQQSDQQWTWLDGTPFSYAKWAKGFPLSSVGTSDCSITDVSSSEWSNDVACSAKRCFVCGVRNGASPAPPATSELPGTSLFTFSWSDYPDYSDYPDDLEHSGSKQKKMKL